MKGCLLSFEIDRIISEIGNKHCGFCNYHVNDLAGGPLKVCRHIKFYNEFCLVRFQLFWLNSTTIGILVMLSCIYFCKLLVICSQDKPILRSHRSDH